MRIVGGLLLIILGVGLANSLWRSNLADKISGPPSLPPTAAVEPRAVTQTPLASSLPGSDGASAKQQVVEPVIAEVEPSSRTIPPLPSSPLVGPPPLVKPTAVQPRVSAPMRIANAPPPARDPQVRVAKRDEPRITTAVLRRSAKKHTGQLRHRRIAKRAIRYAYQQGSVPPRDSSRTRNRVSHIWYGWR